MTLWVGLAADASAYGIGAMISHMVENGFGAAHRFQILHMETQ